VPVTPFVAPELFERLVEYANEVQRNKEPSSAPIDFCDNFYAQFFQNRMKQEITGFGNAAKESAVKLRLKVQARETREIVLLIAWFERYCDIRYDVFSEVYGGGSGEALSAFQDYLDILLERISGWAGLEKLTDIERQAVEARSALQKALQSMKK
jgi:hypothetical protein